MSGNIVSAEVRQSALDALKEYRDDEELSMSKAIEANVIDGLQSNGYLNAENSVVRPIVVELGRFAAYAAATVLGIQFAMDVELLGYSVVLLTIALLALATNQLLPDIRRLIQGGVA